MDGFVGFSLFLNILQFSIVGKVRILRDGSVESPLQRNRNRRCRFASPSGFVADLSADGGVLYALDPALWEAFSVLIFAESQKL